MAWAGDRPVLVALSGGGDSVALLHLLVDELGAGRVRAVIVDHALRDGSADDCAHALTFARALNVRADVLTLRWDEGANRAQQAARQARYAAICEYARAGQLNTIAAAHTADDQAETVLMRAANGSTWRGLAGIAPFAFAPLWPEGRGVALARPLLAARREPLRIYLRARGAQWIEDPANANPKFERVRVRQRLAALEADGLDPMRLAHLAARFRLRSDALDRAASKLIAESADLEDGAVICLDRWNAPAEVRRRALSAMIAAVGGASREPAWTEIEALEARVMRGDLPGVTHSGVEFSTTGGAVVLRREAGALLGRADGALPHPALPLRANVEAIWDGRLAITPPEEGWSVVPARNAYAVAFKNALDLKTYREAETLLRLRPLVAARVAHAFAPDINRAKP